MRTLVSFGAVGNGIVDDTAAVQAAATFGGEIDLQNLNYLVRQTININKPTRLVGEGQGNCSFIAANGMATLYPVLFNVNPTLGLNPYGYAFENLSINPQVLAQVDPIAICFSTTTLGQFILQPKIIGCSIGLTNGVAIASVNINTTGGIAQLHVKDNVINGGIFLNTTGDSHIIEGNSLSGPGIGIFSSFVAGANTMVIDKNNITNAGGSVYLINPVNARITKNQFEAANTGYSGVGALVYLQGGAGGSFEQNQINTLTYCDALYLNQTHDLHVGPDNSIHVGTGFFHYHLVANTNLNMDATNQYYTNNVEGAATSH